MFCTECGFKNLNDSKFCSMCGITLECSSADILSVGTISCASCSSLNEDLASYCRFCGEKVQRVLSPNVAKLVFVGASSFAMTPSLGFDIPDHGLDSDLPPSFMPDKSERLLARLDRMEEELVSRLSQPLPEPDVSQSDELDEKQEKLALLSSTLDSLISDLMQAEINEAAYADFIHPDESGFPSKKPTHYTEPLRRRWGLQEILVLFALIAAIFLVGLSTGLWSSYFFGA